MRKVIKSKGKEVIAYRLDDDNETIQELMEEQLIKKIDDETYEVFSQEAVNGEGQLAKKGDYIKLDSSGKPYPNTAEFFKQNHEPLGGDRYLQKPKPLDAWTSDMDKDEPAIRFLLDSNRLTLDESSEDKYFNAELWGAMLSSPKDSVLIFYSIDKDDSGQIVDASFNFVIREEFDKTYVFCDEATDSKEL